MSAAEDLLRQALALPDDERRALAVRLLESVDDVDPEVGALGRPPGILSEDDPGFDEEMELRAARPDRSVPAAEAFAAARARLAR